MKRAVNCILFNILRLKTYLIQKIVFRIHMHDTGKISLLIFFYYIFGDGLIYYKILYTFVKP